MLPLRPSGHACLAAFFLVAAALSARAGTLPADALPLPNRVANAEVIVVGKVTSIEDKPVIAKNKTEYKIAVVTVSSSLLAPKGTKTVRLGFVPPPPMVVINPPPFQATVGQEGCYFLTKHGEGDFFVASGQLSFLDKSRDGFAKDVALIERCTKLLENPAESLKAKDAQDRFLTAGMLVYRYTTRSSATAKKEAIPAEESKRILEAMASADWTAKGEFTHLSPMMVLHRLPLTVKDGWKPPPATDAKAYATYAQTWLMEHAESYRIERYVAEKGK
jgi:hypothetical protein